VKSRWAGLALVVGSMWATGAGAQQPLAVQSLSWMQGCWARVAGPRTVEEQWMAPRGGTMLGMGRTVQADRLVEWEALLLREENGQLVYEAHPSGQAPNVFRTSSVSDTLVVFADPTHDFPQRIGYQKGRADSLIAWIEGTQNGQPRRVAYPYAKVACPR
jgi:hypothetical protein